LAWGSLNIVLFGVASVAYVLMLRKGDEKNGQTLALVAAVLALGLPIYTGYDLSVHQSRPVWNTPVMPVLFVALAMASGAAVSSLLAASNTAAQATLRQYLLWSVGAVGVILISMLGTTNYGGTAEELTFIILTTGTMGLIFVGLGIVGGTLAPVALLLAPQGRQQGGAIVAALLVLMGGAALRYAILMAPQQLQTLF
jgi:formate-dependent nitrite reductase membrane component NrfD